MENFLLWTYLYVVVIGGRHVPIAEKKHKYCYFFTFMPYNLRLPAGTNSKFEFFPQNLKNDHNYSTQNFNELADSMFDVLALFFGFSDTRNLGEYSEQKNFEF